MMSTLCKKSQGALYEKVVHLNEKAKKWMLL